MVGTRKIIAACISRIQDEASQNFVTAMHNAILGDEYGLFVYNTCTPPAEDNFRQDPQMSVFELMDFDIIDFLIVHEEYIRNQAASDYLIEKGLQAGVPVIVVGEAHEGCINIQFDREAGFSEMVRHMVEVHGKKKLHFMGGIKGNPYSDLRLHAFEKVLKEHGLPFDDSMVSYGDFWSVPTEAAMAELLKRDELPEAILCANDMMALTVIDVLQRNDIAVPKQVAVTGFDGIEQVAYSSPRISTVVCDEIDFAKKVIDTIKQIEEWDGQSVSYFVPATLSIGQTCGCDGEKSKSFLDYIYLANDRLYRYQDEDLTLSKIIANIQRCETMEQVAQQMRQEIFYDMTCVVEKEYMDETMDYVYDMEEDKPLDRDMILLFDTDLRENFKPYRFPLNEVVPRMEGLLNDNRPLIFTALHYMDAPMGYLCFHFAWMEFGSYVKIPQTITAFNNSIAAFRNLQYERYLMSRIDEMYKTDALTGLYNRKAFDSAYNKMMDEIGEDKSITVLLADLDQLKYINDNFGHKEGDFAIQMVAQAIQRVCPVESIFTRFGGDEMLGVCKGKLDVQALQGEFEKFFRDFNTYSRKPYPVLASIGIDITGEKEVLGFEQLVERADKLMYIEKEQHRKLRKQLDDNRL